LTSDTRSGRGVLRAFPSWNVDLALGKMASVGNRMKAGFSFEFFNLFNHVIFANPSLNLFARPNFGVITGQANSPRRIQAGLRVEW
jgi:hypothetical protein